MWILIVLTLQSGVTTAAFTAEKECVKAASWVIANSAIENRPDLQPVHAACFKTN
jgi:hypothetical protein